MILLQPVMERRWCQLRCPSMMATTETYTDLLRAADKGSLMLGYLFR